MPAVGSLHIARRGKDWHFHEPRLRGVFGINRDALVRIFIGTTEIAGYYARLARGLGDRASRVQFVSYDAHPFEYEENRSKGLPQLIRETSRRIATIPPRSFPARLFWFGIRAALSTLLLLKALLSFDAFVFGFGKSFLPWNVDLWILRTFGKKIVINMGHGTELRPPYVDGARQTFEGVPLGGAAFYRAASRASVRSMRVIERCADYIIGAPFSSTQFASRRLFNFFAIGVPVALDAVGDAPLVPNSASVRILHSPSHPAAKGSYRIREAVEAVLQRGFEIEFVEQRGRSNAEVLHELQECDFVIDQLYSDTPLAGFATEAAWFGKPAVVGGYRLEHLKDHVPDGMYPPSQTCHPDDVEAAIERLIVEPEYRRALGKAAQQFVRAQWAATLVAERYMRLLADDVPAHWWLEPKDVIYVEGAGQPIERSRQSVRDLIAAYGVRALQLSHRPDLEQAFLDLAGLGDP